MFSLVARNPDDTRESYVFHTTATLQEAIDYRNSKRESFKSSGGWYIEIETPEGTLFEEVLELA